MTFYTALFALFVSTLGLLIPLTEVNTAPRLNKILDVNLDLGIVRYQAAGYSFGKQVVVVSDQRPAKEFQVYQLDKNIAQLKQFTMPAESVIHSKGYPVKLRGRPGYLSFPKNGNYFIWYPQLGSEIFFFDSSGKFLYEKKESRYLVTSDQGGYLLAVAGDQSRAELLKPDLSKLFSAEGFLMVSYALFDAPESPYRAGLAFMNGDIVISGQNSQEVSRFSLNKSIRSAFFTKTGLVFIHAAGESGSDTLSMFEYNDEKLEEAWTQPLKGIYPYKVPITWSNSGHYGYLLAKELSGEFNLWKISNSGIYHDGAMKQPFLKQASFDTFRFEQSQGGIILYSNRFMMVFSEHGYVNATRFKTRINQFWSDEKFFWSVYRNDQDQYTLRANTMTSPELNNEL